MKIVWGSNTPAASCQTLVMVPGSVGSLSVGPVDHRAAGRMGVSGETHATGASRFARFREKLGESKLSPDSTADDKNEKARRRQAWLGNTPFL